jgi:hypothetical protein
MRYAPTISSGVPSGCCGLLCVPSLCWFLGDIWHLPLETGILEGCIEYLIDLRQASTL